MAVLETCPICNSLMQNSFSAKILGKYSVKYFVCPRCGLLKTEKPYWLESAYQNAIADTDTGIVSRNIVNCKRVLPIIFCFNNLKSKVLDVAGGYGLLTRLLRDAGVDCYTTDKYCDNLFAKSFEPDNQFSSDVMMAFEVFEHIDNPVGFLLELFEKYNSKTVIFSTNVFKGSIPETDWWYYSFETGQHISFYQKKTLLTIANIINCTYYNISQDLHVISKVGLPKIIRIILLNKYLRSMLYLFIKIRNKKKSYTYKDYLFIKTRI